MRYYDKDDVFEFYFATDHGTYEIFTMCDLSDPRSVRALAEQLLKEKAHEDDQIPPHASELALLLAANAHEYQREFWKHYGMHSERTSEEIECRQRGWYYEST